MKRLVDLIGRCRERIPRESRWARILEPIAWMITFRGSMRSTLRYVRRHGLTVGAGPLAGLRYPRSAILHVPGLASRLAGTYELELRNVIDALIASRPAVLINIGAADGYYAVGMASRCPELEVIAYEADPYRRWVCTETARCNGLGGRVDVRGTCTPAALARLNPPDGSVVICDCDGAEVELIDPVQVGWLRRSTLLVEVHETFAPGAETTLGGRLEGSHALEWIQPTRRYLGDPVNRLLWTTGLSPVQQETLMSELRPVPTPWLWATPSVPG